MRQLSEEGRRTLEGIAARYGVSLGAVEHLLMAIIAGQATQAQFNHPDLGGMGQWSQGGMIMVGDMFNNALKANVAGLCSELAALVRGMDLLGPQTSHQSQYQGQGAGVSLFVPGALSAGNWWPEEFGHPASTGAQNDLRYAFFPAIRRLAIDVGGQVTVYDTKDHRIGGFSQQQGGDQSLSFTSQHGLVKISELDVVRQDGTEPANTPASGTSAPSAAPTIFESPAPEAAEPQKAARPAPEAPRPDEDIFDKIERLAALHAKGILTDQEFETKKSELLSRL
ncbi:SHOCT domain-containing protein [Rhizobium sullae]|uniref:Putative oligomerization/nucleic acid binding protein n=1 Tax=Rhizobium sullae TaxID=50338 RepID=A0A4R3Q2T1_RHISU|nr:SHOCT domain-containing protein [Rhizobium sullae]TCU15413.1 putative oligomerization/nucleic acid binding protein [Rhizobium sullae]